MRVAFIVDPLPKLKAAKDSTIFMMREAARRGHKVFAFEAGDMALLNNRVLANVSSLTLSDNSDAWYQVTSESEMPLADFECKHLMATFGGLAHHEDGRILDRFEFGQWIDDEGDAH